MLKAMRDNLKSLAWVLWAVIAVFILLVFVDFGTVSPGTSGAGVAATMGDYEVTWQELRQRHDNLVQQARAVYGEQFSQLEPQLQLQRQALEQVLNGKILVSEAERLGLRVSDEEVRESILELPLFQDESGRFAGQQVYEDYTRRQFGGPTAFENLLREDLLRNKLFDVMEKSVHVTDQEVEQAYREDVERAAIRYLLLPASRFADEVQADAAALESHYQENRDRYALPEQRVIDYLLVDRGVLRTRMDIPQDELRAYYDANQDEFRREEEVQARHILLRTGEERTVEEARAELEALERRIEGGEDFAAIAREVSEDPGSGAQGGDLGYFGRGRMVPEFEEAAFAAETGELVGPVVSSFGVHLLEVTDRRPEGTTSFEEARESIRNRLASDRLEERAAERARELLAELEDVPEGELRQRMEALAEGDDVVRFETSAPFGANAMVPGLGRSPELDAMLATMDEGDLGDGVATTPRGPAVVRLAERREPRVPELSEVEDQVRREVETELRQERAAARLEEIRRGIGASDVAAGLSAAAAELGVELVDAPELGGTGTVQGLGFVPAVNEAALGAEQGDLVGPVETPQGPVLFEVTEREGFDAEELASQSEEIRGRLVQERFDRLLSSLILERKRQEGGIRPSRQLQEQLGGGAVGPV
jgi:peptidyl-prolyl cis-trans isomerase D